MQTRKQDVESLKKSEASVWRVRSIVEALQITQQELARATGIDQSQVSRILRGHFRRSRGNARKLLNYANQRARKAGYDPQEQQQLARRIETAALDAWDGTEAGCEGLVEVLTAVSRLRKQA